MEELQLVQDLSQLNESYLKITERNQSNKRSANNSSASRHSRKMQSSQEQKLRLKQIDEQAVAKQTIVSSLDNYLAEPHSTLENPQLMESNLLPLSNNNNATILSERVTRGHDRSIRFQV